MEPAFDYIFDINFDNEEATASLKYLKDGNFIDNATKSLDIQLVTYNGEIPLRFLLSFIPKTLRASKIQKTHFNDT